MSATTHFRGQIKDNHTVMSSVMKKAQGQEPGRTNRIDNDWF